jgi:murein DD-endopeptidase MepM/ murein hydrolase activator NlpD
MKTNLFFLLNFFLLVSNLFSWTWPISNSNSPNDSDTITSPFGPRLLDNQYNFHKGIDIHANENTDVHAAYSGSLVVAEYQGGNTGGIVSISDGTQKTVYMHLNSWTNLVPGSYIGEGDWIGQSGGTGAGANDPHLHFEYRDGTNHELHPLMVMPYNDNDNCQTEMLEDDNRDWKFRLKVPSDELDIDYFFLDFEYYDGYGTVFEELYVDYSFRENIPTTSGQNSINVLNGNWTMTVHTHNFHPSHTDQIVDFQFTSNSPDIYMITVEGDFYTAKDVWDGSLGFYNFPTHADDFVISNNLNLIHQNHPNPFNPSTTISYSLADNIKNPKIEIYNIKGQLVRALELPEEQGANTVNWDGRNKQDNPVSSGVYLYRLVNDGKAVQSRKMMMLK